VAWWLFACAAVWVAWTFPLLLDHRHYFYGDTQNAYYGWFHHFGDALLHGRWPMLDVHAGSAGNPLAEGQMGLYSPLSALIGLGAAVAPQVVVYATLLKFALATIGVTGCFLLARSYGVRPSLAAVAAVAVQLGGSTLSSDAPRWLTGLMVVALLPWAWWGLRRLVAGNSVWPALVACGLVVTIGYVYGTMYLILVLAGLLLESLLLGDSRAARRLLLAGVFSGLLTVTVYLPGILTAPVTWRNQWMFGGSGYLEMDPVTFLLSAHPTAVPPSVPRSTAGPADALRFARQVPFSYIAWFLPLVLWVDLRRLRRQWRSLVSLAVPFVLLVVWTLLPYQMGPIRMPGRVMSVATLATVLLLAVVLERAGLRRPAPGRLLLSVAWAVGAAFLAALLFTPRAGLQLVAGVVVVAALLAAAWAASQDRRLAVAVILASVGITVFQFSVQPDSVAQQRNAPSRLADYQRLLAGSEGDVLAIGGRPGEMNRHPRLGRSFVTGSLWDLTGKPVHTGYTTMGFRAYNFRFCVRFNGDSRCPDALQRWFRVEPETGMRWVDLHAISTVVVLRPAGRPLGEPPEGWHVVDRDGRVETWERDQAVPAAGGVVWTSPGTTVRQVAESETSTSFVVERVGDDASVVLSRLAWPGYRVEGAHLGKRLGGHLVRVRLTPDDVGETVVVTFRPPGWRLEMACLVAALLLGVGWSVLDALGRRRRRADGAEPTPGPGRAQPLTPVR
jgi:hypothetical protein